MKTKALIIIAAVAVLTASCGRLNRQIKGIITYPTTPEEVAEMAELYNSDAALVVTKADTQYVLYRDRDHDGCYTMRYVSKHRCRHDFSARGQKFGLGNTEQPMVLKHTGGNSLTLSIDSLTIAVADINATDSTLTFRLGFDKADLNAVLYLYGKASKSKDPLAETSIQQMLFVALSLDSLLVETEMELEEAECELEKADSSLAALESELEQAERELDKADEELEHAAASRVHLHYADYSRLDSLASALGFANKESKADNDHMYFKVWGGRGGSTKCYERMERMSEFAGTCHTAGYSVHHKPRHRGCTFTARW